MASLNVENIPDDLYARLQQLAAAQNRSISEEVLSLLERVLQAEEPKHISPEATRQLLAEIRERRDRRPVAMAELDSTALIREDRDSR